MSAIEDRPIGFGRLKRKEDARFIRGKGTYLDDIRLPGMVHAAILRSPFAHAKINSIDTSAALAHPGVAAVITRCTFGCARAREVSIETIRACAYGLRSIAPCTMPGSLMSSR